MNEFRVRESGLIKTEQEIRSTINAMLPAVLTQEVCDSIGIDAVLLSPQPTTDSTHYVVRDGVEQDINGNWIQKWTTLPLPQETIDSNLASTKTALAKKIDDEIATVYAKFLRFEAEYLKREEAARTFKASGYQGEPSTWITAFSTAANLPVDSATNLIISQADNLKNALEALGALRMQKYSLVPTTSIEAAQTVYNGIKTQIDTISRGLT